MVLARVAKNRATAERKKGKTGLVLVATHEEYPVSDIVENQL